MSRRLISVVTTAKDMATYQEAILAGKSEAAQKLGLDEDHVEILHSEVVYTAPPDDPSAQMLEITTFWGAIE